MSGLIVIDVGNTRVKWGRCEGGRVAETVALPPNAPRRWREQLRRWAVPANSTWIVSGVHPQHRQALIEWLCSEGINPVALALIGQLPLAVHIEKPGMVGIDRLLNAVAANTRRPPGFAAAIIDAGTAVTVDLVDEAGVFRGGAIFPGLRLMAQALHEHTALLPVVDVDRAEPLPGTSTAHAIRVGVLHAVLGGVTRIVAAYRLHRPDAMNVYMTGGDGPLLLAEEPTLGEHWPEMTLEGILHSVPKAATHA